MDLTGEIIGGKYDLKAKLGGGGTASVYLGQRVGTADRFAVKVIPTDDAHAQRLVQREVDMLKKLDHPNIVRFVEDGHDTNLEVVFLVLEYIEGVKLRDHVLNTPSVTATLDLFRQVLEALNHAHGRGVVHRDVKPDNVLVVTAEDRPVAKVLDFGIAGITTTVAPQHTIRSYYTPLFAPPEQLRGEGVQRPADLYATALMFLYLLAGRDTQDEVLRGGGKQLLFEPALAALGNGEGARGLHEALVRTVSEKPEERAKLPDLLFAVRRAADELAERLAVPIYLTNGLIEDIDLQEDLQGAPGQAARYVQKALSAGGGRVFAALQKPRQEGRNLSFQIGNGASGRAFSGFLSDDQDYIILLRELDSPDGTLKFLSEQGLRCAVDPVVAERREQLDKPDSAFEEFVHELRRAMLRAERDHKDHKERKSNQTFAQWEKLIDLKKELVDEEKLPPLKYQSVEYVEKDHFLRVSLAEPIEAEQFDVVASSDYAVTISAQDWRSGRPRQVSIGSVIGGRKEKGKVVALEIGLSESVSPRVIESILPTGEIQTDLVAQEVVLKREKRALNDARFSGSLNPELYHVLSQPAKASPVSPVHVGTFFNDRLDRAQREAVELALGTDSLFLIQGPPGTGKTSVITELILQILQRHPTHRILVTSQSNIAVDNALEKVHRARPDLRMVRFGNEEKIEPSARPLMIKPAVKRWQGQIAADAEANWAAIAQENHHLLDGAKKGQELQKVRTVADRRAQVGQELADLVERSNEPYSPRHHAAFVRLANSVGGLLGEKSGLEEELREAIAAYAERYEAQPPEDSLPEWLEAESRQIKELLGEDNEHYDRFMQLQDLLLNWLERLNVTHDDLMALYMEHVTVVGSTCIKIGAGTFKDLTFDWVIVDEAGRATPAETLVPAVKGQRVVLVGDHKQLPPVVEKELVERANEEGDWEKADLEESLFEHLYKYLPESNKRTLTNQYRMHPSIGDLVSELFYDKQISSEEVNIAEKEHGLEPFSHPIYWITTSQEHPRSKVFHQQPRGQYSFKNPFEARAVRALLDQIERACAEKGLHKEVGVITAYAFQRSTLEQYVEPRNPNLWAHLDIVIHTVDGFQGKDRDIIIYNLVRSHKDRRLGFTSDYRRLNVALSRAKELLLIVGNDEMAYHGRTPKGVENPFRALIDHIVRGDTDCGRELTQTIMGD